jgi:hypothetical protein
MDQQCNAQVERGNRCRATKDLMYVQIAPPAPSSMMVWAHGLVVALCPKHWNQARDLADQKEQQLRDRDERRKGCIDCMTLDGHLVCTMNCGPRIPPKEAAP